MSTDRSNTQPENIEPQAGERFGGTPCSVSSVEAARLRNLADVDRERRITLSWLNGIEQRAQTRIKAARLLAGFVSTLPIEDCQCIRSILLT